MSRQQIPTPDEAMSAQIEQKLTVDFPCRVLAYSHLPSTNTAAKEWAEELPDAAVILAVSQSAGRGRLGRSFYSPNATGLYMSLFLRRPIPPMLAPRLTTIAAVATAHAIEHRIGRRVDIKWVNDLYMDGRKVCGILTEGAIDPQSSALRYTVIGIGVNLTPPEGGFPVELSNIACAILPHCEDVSTLRAALAADILNELLPLLTTAMPGGCKELSVWQDYRDRCILLGRPITVHRGDGSAISAVAQDLDRDYRLLVRYEDGGTDALDSGEVSVKL